VILPSHSKFRLHRTRRSRVIAKKWFSIWRPSAILNFGNFWFFSHISVDWVKICTRIQNFVVFGRFAAEIWRYYNFQNGGRPPCWIYCDVIISYRKTVFNALDIVLNFGTHRLYTFWYSSTIMFHHSGLKFPIFALIFKYFWKKIWENIKFKCCNPQKARLCVRPRVLNSRCLTYFYICDLYTRRKKLFDWLSVCVLVKKLKLPLFV